MFLNRVAKYAACSGECFVLALIYIDRIIQTNPTFVVNSLNIHRLLITRSLQPRCPRQRLIRAALSVMLGAKFFDDQYFNNAYYAKVGGVPCIEINSLEVEFLVMTNFSLFVSTDQYTQYYTELHNHVQHSNCACHRQHIQGARCRQRHSLVHTHSHSLTCAVLCVCMCVQCHSSIFRQ